jgi:hypothetical protein
MWRISRVSRDEDELSGFKVITNLICWISQSARRPCDRQQGREKKAGERVG